jgi:PKD domain
LSKYLLSSRLRLPLLSAVAVTALVGGTAATAGATTGSSHHSATVTVAPGVTVPASQVRYAVNEPLCAASAKPGGISCYALKRVTVAKGTPGARPYVIPPVDGPAHDGGYAPADFAAAYGFNPALARSSQTIGIVDWYDDPAIASNLATFDANYGLHRETSTSFRKVNQNGVKGNYPSSTLGKGSPTQEGTAGEIALDVEAARGVCHTCKILLVEASHPTDADLAAAENTAVRLGATEVSNSFGGAETGGVPTSMQKAFNHPGVVITASTGDDGWFAWDLANGVANSSESPSFPASSPDVVSVGGTALDYNTSTHDYEQSVWNENDPDDEAGIENDQPQGAGGGGCSVLFSAPAWQSAFPGYSAAGCAGKRLSADVSIDADPQTGFDIYDTWNSGDDGWVTVGGTSLSSPLIAAMWALAGGSGGASHPARSLYTNAATTANVDDVTIGGNGFCDDPSTLNCGNSVEDNFGTSNPNPNALTAGDVDCSFPRNTSPPASAPPLSSECNAAIGFDGPTGVGTPSSPALLNPTSPVASLTKPAKVELHKSASFTAHGTPRISGAHVTSYEFVWGDGKTTTTTSVHAAHTWSKKGSYAVALYVNDSAGQQSVVHATIVVGKPLGLKLFGTSTVKHGHKTTFRAQASDPNTGGKIKKVTWHWGDGHSSTGVKAKHAWHKAGKYKIEIVLTDTTGVKTIYKAKEKVT